MAKEEFDCWNSYLTKRKETIDNLKEASDDVDKEEQFHESREHFTHKIKDHDLKIMKEFFDRFKVSKNQNVIQCFFVLEPLNSQSDLHKVTIIPRRPRKNK